jgi:predicted phosphodiesterase
MSTTSLRIAVASDLHAISGSVVSSGRSHLRADESEDQPGKQPVGGLLKLIRDENLTAQLLICPGDLGDKADPEGIRYAWKALHRVGDALGCKVVLGTTGNHDVDSRYVHNKVDPIEVLKDLSPPYPFPDEASNALYWMRQFCVSEAENYRVIVLNSSAYHGGPDGEQERGRVTPSTLTKIKAYLETSASKPLNLLICHHHPQQHSELLLGEYDWMREGQQLLDLLGSGRYGSWIVVHGHKHHPKITYASGGSSSPIVFSAGSLSAALYQELGTAARNQFYILSFDIENPHDSGRLGRGQAWDWATSRGWVQASTGSGLPASFGFGCRQDPFSLSEAMAASMEGKEAMPWMTMAEALPQLRFVLPVDLTALNLVLEQRHSIRIFFDKTDAPFQLGRVPV